MAQNQPTGTERVEAMSDVTYDIVTVLSNCAEAVDALDEYIDDAKKSNDRDALNLFENLRQDEIRHCDMTKNLIDNLVRQGKF
ncbi:MAG TPA: hypothetical protein VMW65_10450 [Chloroflexota bacterium]|nr:hypothetical protein [Chloroflexota bacterium]